METNEAMMRDLLFQFLSSNAKWVILFLLFGGIIIAIFLVFVIKFFYQAVSKTKEFQLGPLKIKNGITGSKPKDSTPENEQSSFDVDAFINILDLILASNLRVIAQSCIDNMSAIHAAFTEYDRSCRIAFERLFMNIKNEYTLAVSQLIIDHLKIDAKSIRSTTEYVFIHEMFQKFEREWKNIARDITRRNGFIDFTKDISKASKYVDELKTCIFQCIDASSINITSIPLDKLYEAFKEVNKNFEPKINSMFIELSLAKTKVFNKKKHCLSKIDKSLEESASNIINNIASKILGSQETFRSTHSEPIEESNIAEPQPSEDFDH